MPPILLLSMNYKQPNFVAIKMSKTIQELQQEIIDEFSMFEDRMDKYEHIIELGKDLEAMPEELKEDKALIKGCQSKVWLHAKADGYNIHFDADSDAFIVRGLVAILLKVFSNQPIKDVIDANLSFIQTIGLQEMLSPTRSNGFASMVKQMKLYAIALNTQQQ